MYLGIDYGKKRIGLALGQAYPKGIGVVFNSGKKDNVLTRICDIIKENEVTAIVVGYPRRSMGEPGTLAKEIENFSTSLAKESKLPVFYEEERFTSSEAENIFEKAVRKPKSGQIDELSAVLILEQFLKRVSEDETILNSPDFNSNKSED